MGSKGRTNILATSVLKMENSLVGRHDRIQSLAADLGQAD